jgi:hypothetical protein
MRYALINVLLSAGALTPVQASLFNLPANPLASQISNIQNNINGFLNPSGGSNNNVLGGLLGQNKGQGSKTTAAPTTTAAAGGNGGNAANGGAPAVNTAANSLFNPNAPLPAVPTAPAAAATGAPALTNKQQASALQSACNAWVSDTGVVSNFQNIGTGLTTNAQQFKQQAGIGYNAEVDELLHKADIDNLIGNDPTISVANLTLTNGSFQSVVNGLQDMNLNGPARVGDIAAINAVRCPQILPAIDTYCQVAAKFAAKQGVTITATAAVRPSACAALAGGNGGSTAAAGGGGGRKNLGNKKNVYYGGAFNRRNVE